MNRCPNQFPGIPYFASVMHRKPHSYAMIRGSDEYPNIRGQVRFFQTGHGTLVAAEIFGLPGKCSCCQDGIFAFHIHEGALCTGNCQDPFAQAMSHYNPGSCDHPYHAGDLPPLFGNDGYAFSVFLTDRFTACEIIGRTILIHSEPDDFTTQPSGNSGSKIACGVIKKA